MGFAMSTETAAASRSDDTDRGEPAAVKQAQATFAALVATRDATQRALAAI